MKKNILTSFSFCILFSHYIMAQSYSGAESVEFDFANNRYLVSNTSTSQIIARAANGTLSVFATLAAAPYGIEIVGDTLYCCTGGSLRGVNLNTGIQIFSKVIATGQVFLNGITQDPSGNLYLTGFSSKKVYRFNTATRQSNIFVNNTTTTPNGIIYDAYDGINPRLVLAGWGSPATVKSISLADSTLTTLTTTTFGNIDGIAKGKNGNFYIACWSNNSIQRYDSTFANAPTAMVTSGISSPADIYYNQLTDTLAVPFGTNVNFYFFGTLTAQKSLLSNQEINIYPNPSNGIIQISSKLNQKAAINLYELGTGKLVYSENTANLNENLLLDVSNLNFTAGLYLIELISNDGVISRKKLTFE